MCSYEILLLLLKNVNVVLALTSCCSRALCCSPHMRPINLRLNDFPNTKIDSLKAESYVTTDAQSASLSWNKAPIWGLRPDFYYRQKVAGLLMWSALSDERTGLSFTIAAGPRQWSHSRVRDWRLPFSSPPTTCRATTWDVSLKSWNSSKIYKDSVRTSQETHYVTATKSNRLILFRETVAVYCENRTEHTNTLCGQNAKF
jgi:hypothetical protein